MMKRFSCGSHRLPWGLALLSLLAAGCTGPENMEWAEQLALARVHLRAERYHSALSLLQNIPPTEENTPELYLMQVLAHFKLEDYPHAATSLEQANPQTPRLRILLVYLYLLAGDLKRVSSLADGFAPQYRSPPELELLRGHISLSDHQYQEAERHFRAVLSMDQAVLSMDQAMVSMDHMAVAAYIGMGHTALLERLLGKAEEYYLRAVFLSTSTDEISPQLALVNLYIATQRYDDAEDTLKLALKRYPNNVMLQMSLMNLYIKLHMNQEAIDLLEAVRNAMPFSDSIKIMAASQYFALQQLDEAYKLISEIEARDGENHYGLILHGEHFFRKGNYELSSNYFYKALSQNSNSYLANYYMGVIHLRSKNIRLATYFLEKSLQVNPNTLNAHLLLGTICLQSHKYALAAEYARAILRVYPRHVGAHLLSGIALYLQGHYDAAKYELDVVEALDPQRPSVKIFHALIELERHQPEAAEKYVSALTASIPEQIFLQAQVLQDYGLEPRHLQHQLEGQVNGHHDPVAWLILGHIYYTGADYARAEVAYRHAMAAPQPTALPHYAMAQVEVGRGNRRQAIAYLEQAVVTDPTFPKSYLALGGLYEQEQDYQQARLTYQRGLQYAPEDPTLLNNLAWAYLMLGSDLATAYRHIRKAITLAPEDPDLQDTLAWWYYLARDYPHAITVLQKIVKAQPGHAIYRYHLGMAYLKSGEREEGQRHLQQALALGIDGEHRRLIQEHMP